MTTIALAERFRICQSFLGAKLHDAKDPGADLSAMLFQVVGSVFTLMQEYETVWRNCTGSEVVDLFGFRYDVGLDPIEVNVERMLNTFRIGCKELGEIWSLSLSPDTLAAVRDLGAAEKDLARPFHFPDDLWVSIVYELACAHKKYPLERGHLLRSLTPLYLARVASFVLETGDLDSAKFEEKIEGLCLRFEQMKPYLMSRWNEEQSPLEQSPELSHTSVVSENHVMQKEA